MYISYWLLEQKNIDIWKLEYDFELASLENGYYITRFKLASDYDHMLNGGPWTGSLPNGCKVEDKFHIIS